VRSAHRKIRCGHLVTLPVGADGADPDAQVGCNVGGRPPLGISGWAGIHRPIVSDKQVSSAIERESIGEDLRTQIVSVPLLITLLLVGAFDELALPARSRARTSGTRGGALAASPKLAITVQEAIASGVGCCSRMPCGVKRHDFSGRYPDT
jgi:hypothetical protein